MKRIVTNRIYLLTIALLLLSANSLFAQDMFDTRTDYAAGNTPYSVFSIDLNGDGHNDLATANTKSDDVSILLGNGDGTFQSAVVNQPPIVTDIPDQTITEGGTFATISLDDYMSDIDNLDSEMTWSYSGNTELTADITARVATISTPTTDWNGAETITFTATDPGLLSDSDPATFTVTAVNDIPIVVAAISDTSVAEDNPPIDNYRDLKTVFSDVEDGTALTYTVESNSNPGLLTASIGIDDAIDLTIADKRRIISCLSKSSGTGKHTLYRAVNQITGNNLDSLSRSQYVQIVQSANHAFPSSQ